MVDFWSMLDELMSTVIFTGSGSCDRAIRLRRQLWAKTNFQLLSYFDD